MIRNDAFLDKSLDTSFLINWTRGDNYGHDIDDGSDTKINVFELNFLTRQSANLFIIWVVFGLIYGRAV